MKIISPMQPTRKLDRNQFLDLEIERLQDEIGVKERIGIPLPLYLKVQYLAVLENFSSVHAKVKAVQEETSLQQSIQTTEFASFRHLPTELRLKIWRLSFTIDNKPRVHCIHSAKSGTNRETFISNQPVSPILHANHESRCLYLSTTQFVFAFNTYINFDTDIIYIPDFKNRDLSFGKFLQCDDIKRIQKLAMRKDFFCDIPLPGHFSRRQAVMLKILSAWTEMYIVFEDGRRCGEEIWKDTDVTFKEFSAKEKRKKAERSYARQHAQSVNEFMEMIDERTTHFRFGHFERGPNYAEPSLILELEPSSS